jgi:hypothetical protein
VQNAQGMGTPARSVGLRGKPQTSSPCATPRNEALPLI